MRKKLFAVLCVALVFFCIMPSGFAYHTVGLDNFKKSDVYSAEEFTDVPMTAWYRENVAEVCKYGLMSGNGDGTFSPVGDILIAEAITVASRIYGVYQFGYQPLFEDIDGLWYEPYVTYAKKFGIVSEHYLNYDAPATRAQFAQILVNAIDTIDLEEVSIVEDGAIPDVPMNADYAEAVYLLYRAGVLSGSDGNGTFHPDDTITRAEAATIITRMIDPDLRQVVELAGSY